MHPYGFSAYQVLMYQTHENSGLNAPRVPRAISSTALPAHDFTLTDSILTLKFVHVKRICQFGEIPLMNLSKFYRKRRTFLPVSFSGKRLFFQKSGDISSRKMKEYLNFPWTCVTFRHAQRNRSSPRPARHS